jgi:hypothetical protein
VSDWVLNIGDWIERHPGTAGWAQALGATLAVIAAVLVPASQARRASLQREADRRLRAKSLAIAIYPELLHIRAVHRHIHRRLLALIDQKRRKYGGPTAHLAGTDLADHMQGFQIPVTDTLRAMVPNFYLLGEPLGPQIQRCIGRSMKYNDLLHTLLASSMRIDMQELPSFIEGGLRQVEACIASIEQTWRVTADEARAFEDHIVSEMDKIPASEGATWSKEIV